jgi:hypothetical protein
LENQNKALFSENQDLSEKLRRLQSDYSVLQGKMEQDANSNEQRDRSLQDRIKHIVEMTNQSAAQNNQLKESVKQLKRERDELLNKLEAGEKIRYESTGSGILIIC